MNHTIILILSILSCVLLITSVVDGQQLEILLSTADRPGDGAPYTRDYTTAPAIVRSGKQLCVSGLWALFTKPGYGTSDISSVTVYPIKSGTASQCTGPSSIASILQQIQSFRIIASQKAGVVATSLLEVCKNAYFLRKTGTDCSIDQASGVNLIPSFGAIKSFALRGTGYYKVCSDVGEMNCACLDVARDGPFMVPSLTSWPKSGAFPTPFGQLTHFSLLAKDACEVWPNVVG